MLLIFCITFNYTVIQYNTIRTRSGAIETHFETIRNDWNETLDDYQTIVRQLIKRSRQIFSICYPLFLCPKSPLKSPFLKENRHSYQQSYQQYRHFYQQIYSCIFFLHIITSSRSLYILEKKYSKKFKKVLKKVLTYGVPYGII